MKRFSLSFVLFAPAAFALAACSSSAPGRPPASLSAAATERKIEALLGQLTLEEKVSMLGGTGFDTKPIPRLGIPSIRMTDGPLGVRAGKQTAFPAGISMAASFNPSLVREVARAIAEETRATGRNMLLGPCVGISRHPFGGRNFEGMGEDPYLAGQIAADYVRGIQSQNVLASVKHFALNDQEVERTTIDTHVRERALFEIHLPAFKAALDAGAWTVMASYNKVNGHWASENDYLLNQVLKKLWGFRGFVVSDWDATHSTAKAANAGLDLEMPFGAFFDERLVAAVRAGEVSEATIDEKVRRLLRAMFAVGLLGPKLALPPAEGPESLAHREAARMLAQESIVLLKNEGILPLRPSVRSVAVIGPNSAFSRAGGGGSSRVIPYVEVSPLEALRKSLGPKIEIRHSIGAVQQNDMLPIPRAHLKPSLDSSATGLRAEYFPNEDLSGEPMLTRVEQSFPIDFLQDPDERLRKNFSVRWSGFVSVPRSGTYTFLSLSDDGARLSVNNRVLYTDWNMHGAKLNQGKIRLEAGRWYPLRLEYFQRDKGALINFGWLPADAFHPAAAVAAAKASDLAIVFTGLNEFVEGEGVDVNSFALPKAQADLIKKVAAANPNTVVVLNGGNPVAMGDWLPRVKGLLHAWYPGQEGSFAIADILLGRVNPSGKLPVSFPKRWQDAPAFGNYPGKGGHVHYKEGIYVGYRAYDARKMAPEFPFGFGLSYTNFTYASPKLEVLSGAAENPRVRMSVALTNSGSAPGAEVAQLYVHEEKPAVDRPPNELKGFAKVMLAPGETKRVSFDLDKSAFAYFDEANTKWTVRPGSFSIKVGGSSRDLPLSVPIELR